MSGTYTNGMPVLDELTGDERIPVDTYIDNGAPPQTAAIPVAMASSGALQLEVPLTGFTITINDGVTRLVLNPAGTLATGAVNLPSNPVNGQLVEVSSTQTQTALTVAAASGHTIVGAAVTALTAVDRVAWVYSDTKWYRVD